MMFLRRAVISTAVLVRPEYLILVTLVWCRVYGWRRVVCRGWRSRQDGRNVLDFKMTPTTPFQKALEAWCQHHSMSQDCGALTQIKASHYINLIQILLQLVLIMFHPLSPLSLLPFFLLLYAVSGERDLWISGGTGGTHNDTWSLWMAELLWYPWNRSSTQRNRWGSGSKFQRRVVIRMTGNC